MSSMNDNSVSVARKIFESRADKRAEKTRSLHLENLQTKNLVARASFQLSKSSSSELKTIREDIRAVNSLKTSPSIQLKFNRFLVSDQQVESKSDNDHIPSSPIQSINMERSVVQNDKTDSKVESTIEKLNESNSVIQPGSINVGTGKAGTADSTTCLNEESLTDANGTVLKSPSDKTSPIPKPSPTILLAKAKFENMNESTSPLPSPKSIKSPLMSVSKSFPQNSSNESTSSPQLSPSADNESSVISDVKTTDQNVDQIHLEITTTTNLPSPSSNSNIAPVCAKSNLEIVDKSEVAQPPIPFARSRSNVAPVSGCPDSNSEINDKSEIAQPPIPFARSRSNVAQVSGCPEPNLEIVDKCEVAQPPIPFARSRSNVTQVSICSKPILEINEDKVKADVSSVEVSSPNTKPSVSPVFVCPKPKLESNEDEVSEESKIESNDDINVVVNSINPISARPKISPVFVLPKAVVESVSKNQSNTSPLPVIEEEEEEEIVPPKEAPAKGFRFPFLARSFTVKSKGEILKPSSDQDQSDPEISPPQKTIIKKEKFVANMILQKVWTFSVNKIVKRRAGLVSSIKAPSKNTSIVDFKGLEQVKILETPKRAAGPKRRPTTRKL